MAAPHLTIDVEGEKLTTPDGRVIPFSLDPLRKRFLLEGGYLDFLANKRAAVRDWLARTGGVPSQ
jgi:3-isopropylmalate dehydratase small subunit